MRLLLRIDARRPASWLALVGAGGAAWWLAAAPRDDGPWLAAALASGAIAAVMAIGDVPAGTGATAGTWAIARAAWPVVGVLVGAAAAGTVAAPGAMLAGIAAATAAILGHGRRDTPAEPLAAALLAGGTAAGVALAVRVAWPTALAWTAPAAAAVGWGVAMIGGRWLRDDLPAGSDEGGATGWGPRGPLGNATATFTMAAALGASLRGGRPRRPAAGWMAWRVAAAPAAVFGWPLVVAAVLATATTPTAVWLGVAAALAGAAAGVALVSALVARVGGGRETALAVSLAPALVAAAACCGPHGMPKMRPLSRGNEVEQSSGFWKTPFRPQDDAGQPQPGGAVPWNRFPSPA